MNELKIAKTKNILNYIIMGYANIVSGQIIKGLLFFILQLSYIFYFIFIGIKNFIGLITLGTNLQGWVYDEKQEINILTQGDNSMILLIYGVSAIVITILFIVLYFVYLGSIKKLRDNFSNGVHINNFKEDLATLIDEKFHVTMLTFPIIGVLLFTIIPIVFMILIAFTNYDHAHQPPGNLFDWIGLTNFINLLGLNGNALGTDKQMAQTFGPVLLWTIEWAVIATSSNFIFGMILAMMINKKGIRFKSMWRTFFVITIAVPQFVSLLIMRRLLSDYGPLNNFLMNAGFITERLQFLQTEFLAKISIILVNLWVGIPYTMLITTGILMNIPADMYEAASIDGASPFKMFTKITMPHVLFITGPYILSQFVGNINNFNVIYLLTKGEPLNSKFYGAGSTDLLVTWLYKLTLERKDYNWASTIGIIIFIISAIFTLITFRRMKSYKNEGDFS